MNTKDNTLLQEYEKRCRAVRDLVHHVVTNEDCYGFYLWGPKGVGKTTGISRALDEIGVTPTIFPGSMTGAALFDVAKNSSDGVLWINDDRKLFKDELAQQYLLAMLAPVTIKGRPKRLVRQSRVRGQGASVEFKGKLIFDANSSVTGSSSLKILEAVEDRMEVHHFGPPDAELAAVMRYLVTLTSQKANEDYPYICLAPDQWKYWQKTTPQERSEIASFIVDTAAERKANLSLRMLRDTVRYYVAQQQYGYSLDWRDKVVKELTQHDTDYQFSTTPSRKDERLNSERQLLTDVLLDAEEFLERGRPYYKATVQTLWCEAAGANDRQFRRRLAEMPDNLRAIYDCLSDGRQRHTVQLSK
jgi:hypothetical protein